MYTKYEIEIAHSSRDSIKYNFIAICAYITLYHCIVLVSIVDLCTDDISGYKLHCYRSICFVIGVIGGKEHI